MGKVLVFGILLATTMCNAAKADETKDALREFGWEGVWSLDCSISNGSNSELHPRGILARLYQTIPSLGDPSRTIKLEMNGHFEQVFRVTYARMVTKYKLQIKMESEQNGVSVKYSSVLTHVDDKIVTISSEIQGTAHTDIPAGVFVPQDLHAGDSFARVTVENGIFHDAKGNDSPAPVFEQCRE